MVTPPRLLACQQRYRALLYEKVFLHSGCTCTNHLGICPKGATGLSDLVGHNLSKCERTLLDRDALQRDQRRMAPHDIAVVVRLTSQLTVWPFTRPCSRSRPDLVSSNDPLKAGPAILYRKGWKSKRRTWLHDTICTDASSIDEGKVRSLCILLCGTLSPYFPLKIINKLIILSSICALNLLI